MCFFRKKVKIPEIPGAIPSPPDSRDIPLSAVSRPLELRELPEKYIIPYKLPVLDQNGYPACVGFSAALIKAEKERREQKPIDFDGLWIYEQCKKIDGYNGPGTYLRIAFKILKNQGAKPLNSDEKEAPKYRIGGYARVDNLTFEGLKSAIYQHGVIQAGFRGSNKGWKTAYIRPPKPGERIWSHAVALIGFNKDYIIFQNSWGEDWGDKGIGYIPKNYLPFEAWAVLVDLPDDFQVKPKPCYQFKKDLVYGMRNKDVKALQDCLKSIDIFPQIIDSTGYYGKITSLAVYHFQKKYKVAPEAEIEALQGRRVGPKTRAKLNELFNA